MFGGNVYKTMFMFGQQHSGAVANKWFEPCLTWLALGEDPTLCSYGTAPFPLQGHWTNTGSTPKTHRGWSPASIQITPKRTIHSQPCPHMPKYAPVGIGPATPQLARSSNRLGLHSGSFGSPLGFICFMYGPLDHSWSLAPMGPHE